MNLFRAGNDIRNLRYILTIIFGDIMELNNFITYVPRSSIPPDPILSPPTFRLNMTSYSHTAAVERAPEDNSPQKSPTESFFFIRISLIISLENISSVSTNYSRASL